MGATLYERLSYPPGDTGEERSALTKHAGGAHFIGCYLLSLRWRALALIVAGLGPILSTAPPLIIVNQIIL